LSGPLCTNIASCIVLYVIFKVPFSCAGLPGTELYINKYTRICQYPFCSARALSLLALCPALACVLSGAGSYVTIRATALSTVCGLYLLAGFAAQFPLLPAGCFACFQAFHRSFFANPFSQRSDIVPNPPRFCQHGFNKNFSDSTKPFSASHYIHYNTRMLISCESIFLILILIFLIYVFTILILRRINIT